MRMDGIERAVPAEISACADGVLLEVRTSEEADLVVRLEGPAFDKLHEMVTSVYSKIRRAQAPDQ